VVKLCKAHTVTCPLCGQRKARRACPALGRDICPTCCATKRLREIACPDGCVYLASARAHPPAVVQRQRERDTAFLVSVLEGLSEPQVGLLSLAQQQLHRYRPTAIPALNDADVAQAASAMAATLETATRGIVYEHQAPSLPGQRLLGLFRQLQAELEARKPVPARLLAPVFRRLERASREAAGQLGGEGVAFLDFVDRLAAGAADRSADRSSGVGTGRSAGSEAEERAVTPRIIIP
jgi:hypothetical protein